MSLNKHFLAAAVVALSTGAALAQDKNPLMPPKLAAAKVADAAPVAGAPTPDMKLPPAVTAPQPLASSVQSGAGSHLSGLSVVAIVGAKAILRGQVGQSTNFALLSSSDGGEAPKPGAGAPTPAGDAQSDAKKGPAVTIVVTHAQPLQLADGVWMRPDVSGTTVRLYQQSSKEKAVGPASEVLVYAASLETLSPTAPLAADKGDDKKQDDKK